MAGSSAVMPVPLACNLVIYAGTDPLLVSVISIVSEDLETDMPTSEVILVPEPSAAALATMSVVEATVVHVLTPTALLAEPRVG